MLNANSSRRTRGISLVEMMVGIAVGLVVLVGLSSVYVNAVGGGRTTMTANQLNQELRALTDIMVNDLRRAGYWGAAAKGLVNPFTTATTLPRISNLAADRGCILYSYDATFNGGTAGNVDAGVDFFGFRLNDEGVVQAVRSATLADTATDCSQVAWENLTDRYAVRITKLTFTTEGSKCIAFVPADYEPNNTDTFKQWKTDSPTGIGPACVDGAPGAPSPYPPATQTFVETRQVNIVVEGYSVAYPDLKASIRETALIRNNRVITP